MSTPTQPMPGRTEGPLAHAEIRRFVGAVERALDDLPADDVAELVGGLEADLTEAWVAEGTSPAQRFGSPEDYAGELRAAVGLPPRVWKDAGRQGIRVALRAVATDARLRLDRMPGWPGVRRLAVTMQPVWWALRGYAAYLVAVNLFTRAGVRGHLVPQSLPLLAVLLLLVLVSVELGRRSLTIRNTAWRAVLVVLNVFAFGALVILGGLSGGSGVTYVYVGDSRSPQTGLYNGDYKVVNVFPYDQEGKPLTGVQLFDDRGRPIEIGSDGRRFVDGDYAAFDLVPAIGKDSQQLWNVFPMRVLPDPEAGPKSGPQDAKKPDPTQDPLLVGSIATSSPEEK